MSLEIFDKQCLEILHKISSIVSIKKNQFRVDINSIYQDDKIIESSGYLSKIGH